MALGRTPITGNRIAVLVAASILLWSAPAAADPPPPCPSETTEVVTRSGVAVGQNFTIPVQILPCQTVSVRVVDGGNPQAHLFDIHMYGGTNNVLYYKRNSCYASSCTTTWPDAQTYPDHLGPFKGMVGPPGLITSGTITAIYSPGTAMNFTVTVTKRPRQGYNVGGQSFAAAVALTALPVTLLGSLDQSDPGQFFTFTLAPQQTVYFYATAAATPNYSGSFNVRVYRPDETLAATPIGGIPGARNRFTGTFTNTGATPTTYFLRLTAGTFKIHDFNLTLQTTAAQFTVIFDADSPLNFDPWKPVGPQDDLTWYVPGSRQDGTSLPLPTGTNSLQRLQVIAAYTDASGYIVKPPNPTVAVTFSFIDENGNGTSSAIEGIAMNFPDPRGMNGQDFVLATGSATFSTTDHTARVALDCWDYGGFAVIRVKHGTVAFSPTRIPQDNNGNLTPDAGWLAETAWVADVHPSCVGIDTCDQDNNPNVSGDPIQGLIGDGFAVYEEYRGFVTRGSHRRTNPWHKDLFASSNIPDIGLAYAFPALPTVTHRVWGNGEGLDEYGPDRVMNEFYRNIGYGGDIPGHSPQRAVRVLKDTYDLNSAQTILGCVQAIAATQSCEFSTPPEQSPNEADHIKIFLAEIHEQAVRNNLDAANELNVTRHTQGHEVGHAVHMTHDGTQLMEWGVLRWPAPGSIGADYSPADESRIRLHLKW